MDKRKIAIALQGGGAHGAFAWGVLDKILEDDRLEVVGISGTSAGGMNAAAVIQGMIKGGSSLARNLLNDYWREMSELSQKISPLMSNPLGKVQKDYNLDYSPGYILSKMVQGVASPYQWNPLNINPFFDFLKSFFDFEAFHNNREYQIFLGTTHIKTGKIKIFSNNDMCADVLLASACLPFLFQAVEVNGEHYWDGGYIANPAIYPLIEHCDCIDIVIVQLTRSHCQELPKTKEEIEDRLKEITYNGCLVREMRAIYFITQLIDKGIISEGKMKRINIHVLKDEGAFHHLNLSSALNTDMDFLSHLKEAGQRTAEKWLAQSYNRIGTSSPMDEGERLMFSDFVS